jgi:hypothetical protein
MRGEHKELATLLCHHRLQDGSCRLLECPGFRQMHGEGDRRPLAGRAGGPLREPCSVRGCGGHWLELQ